MGRHGRRAGDRFDLARWYPRIGALIELDPGEATAACITYNSSMMTRYQHATQIGGAVAESVRQKVPSAVVSSILGVMACAHGGSGNVSITSLLRPPCQRICRTFST